MWQLCALIHLLLTYLLLLIPPSLGERGIVMSLSVCVSVCLCLCVCLSVHKHMSVIRNYLSDLHVILVHVTCGRGPRLAMLRYAMYFRLCGWRHNGGVSILLQRVTSLRCLAQADAPAASYWLPRVLDDGGRRD